MRINLSKLSGVVVGLAIATGLSTTAIAQPKSKIQPKANETLADTFERAFFSSDPDFFANRSFERQLDWMFGLNGFTDNEISRDAQRVHNLYKTGLERQVSSEPPIRTRDLPNPYESSVLTSPTIDANQGEPRREFQWEKQ
jgi:hypothetical protein